MTAKILRIKRAVRSPVQDDSDEIALKFGVNVIVGELNAGKTKWLQMIDFILGDPGKPEDAFDQELVIKYDRVAVVIDIAGEEISVERRWKESGSKTKIFVNGDGVTPKQFSEFILGKLAIPIIHVPSGNPYDRTWPELSWREMFRHMYKQERFWSDFAQKQPEVTRSACILNFLDVASNLYPKEYGDLVSKKKLKDRLEAQKDVFVNVMQDLAVEIVGQKEMSVAVTPESILESRNRHTAELLEIDDARASALANFDRKVLATDPSYEAAKQQLESHYNDLGRAEADRNNIIRRQSELTEYAKTLEAELSRFARAKSSISVLADIKVTHCPVCDQEISDKTDDLDHCPLCGRIQLTSSDDIPAGLRRIEFEEQQVTEELDELRNLLEELKRELLAANGQIVDINQRISTAKRSLNAARGLSVRSIPPEIALLDHESGRITAELQQLNRIDRALHTREDLNAKIATLDEEIATLDAEIKRLAPVIDYEGYGDLLSDRMNDYLNQVNADNLTRWKTGRISTKLRRDTFELYLNDQPWTVRAGGTANYLVQIAYHYALLSLTKDGQYNYPGFLIIDFPPHFQNAGDLRDSENYLLKPFVNLCAKDEMVGAQVIIAGRAFDNLENANVIHL